MATPQQNAVATRPQTLVAELWSEDPGHGGDAGSVASTNDRMNILAEDGNLTVPDIEESEPPAKKNATGKV